MVKNILRRGVLIALLAISLTACGRGDGGGGGSDTYDVVANGIPKFARTVYIDLTKIQKISMFRSAEGHDYSDSFETCRSMKHYYWPFGGNPGQTHTPSWVTINIYAPVQGTVSNIFQEWAGTQIQIKSKEFPAFYFIIFHVNLANPLNVGDTVTAGQLLGTHIGDQTISDIAVRVNTPSGWKLVSYFDVMTDSVFQGYQARGLSLRTDAIISKEARDADPLTCSGETFTNSGNLENWITLN